MLLMDEMTFLNLWKRCKYLILPVFCVSDSHLLMGTLLGITSPGRELSGS